MAFYGWLNDGSPVCVSNFYRLSGVCLLTDVAN